MRVPEHLSHKPIIAVDNYHKMDGIYNETDAKGLSIGRAQWKSDEFSAKVWRHKEDSGWSRQSEELPLHRVLDLAILILSVYNNNSSDEKIDTFLKEIVIDEEGLNEVKDFLEENDEVFEERITELKRLLQDQR